MVHANRLLIRANKNAIRVAVPHREYFLLKRLQSTEQPQSRLRPRRRSCCFVRLVDMRHATSSTFKDKKIGQAPKS
jgi:hypothetical protein